MHLLFGSCLLKNVPIWICNEKKKKKKLNGFIPLTLPALQRTGLWIFIFFRSYTMATKMLIRKRLKSFLESKLWKLSVEDYAMDNQNSISREIMEYLQSPDTSSPKTTWMFDVNTAFGILSQDKVG